MSDNRPPASGRYLLAAFLWAIPTSIYRAWVFSVLWRWFVVPLGAPSIGVAVTFGLLVMVGLLHPTDYEPPRPPVTQMVLTSLLVSSTGLAFGWVALQVAS